jgi:hypothetical protein
MTIHDLYIQMTQYAIAIVLMQCVIAVLLIIFIAGKD